MKYFHVSEIFSEAAAKESEKFTVSLIVGDDVIPRLSLPNIKILSADIKHSIQTCSLPKYQIFGESLLAVTQTDCKTSLQATAVLAVSVGTTKLLSLLSWTDCTHLVTSPPPPPLQLQQPPTVSRARILQCFYRAEFFISGRSRRKAILSLTESQREGERTSTTSSYPGGCSRTTCPTTCTKCSGIALRTWILSQSSSSQSHRLSVLTLHCTVSIIIVLLLIIKGKILQICD